MEVRQDLLTSILYIHQDVNKISTRWRNNEDETLVGHHDPLLKIMEDILVKHHNKKNFDELYQTGLNYLSLNKIFNH